MVTYDVLYSSINYTTRNPLCDSLKSSYAVANEALDLEEDDLAEQGDEVLVFFLLSFLGPLGGHEDASCPGLSGKLISVGSMDLAGSKSAEIKNTNTGQHLLNMQATNGEIL